MTQRGLANLKKFDKKSAAHSSWTYGFTDPLTISPAGSKRGRVGKEWTTVEPDSEIKLVRVSEGTFRARLFMRN